MGVWGGAGLGGGGLMIGGVRGLGGRLLWGVLRLDFSGWCGGMMSQPNQLLLMLLG